MHIAVTGGIGSGKTAVSDLLADLGAVVIDADLVAREVVEPGTPGLAAIVDRFGPDMLTEQGQLDRERLASVVFADAAARADLNAIVHPLVRARSAELAAAAPAGAVVVQVIPLLVEAGLARAFDRVVVVDLPVELQVRRLVEHRGMTEQDAHARIGAQIDRAQRLAVADVVVDNSGSPQELAAEVGRVWADLKRSQSHRSEPGGAGGAGPPQA